MSNEHFRSKERFLRLAEKFREKGAISSDKAMTINDLGLPPRFKYLMQRRLGKLGIFSEVNGKYYLSEERLVEFREKQSQIHIAGDSRKKLLTLRLVRVITVILFISLLLVNIFVKSSEFRLITSVFLVVLLVISILQFYYLTRTRRRVLS